MTFSLEHIVRKNIRELKPYSSARNEFSGKASVFLDANENPYNSPYNRYPDPLQRSLKERIGEIYRISEDNIFLGNGSDEAIDLAFRIFCNPGVDNIISIEPSYGMYSVCADINNVEVRKSLLNNDYSFSASDIIERADENTKLVFLCSPNNPTGNLMDRNEIIKLLKLFYGIVVIDEAYIDFAGNDGMLPFLADFPNLIVLRTFSKAWGLAGIRLGMAFASTEIITYYSNIKYPYNLNVLTQNFALEKLKDQKEKDELVTKILEERKKLEIELGRLNIVEKVFPSDANFLLVRIKQAKELYNYLKRRGIIVRDRSSVILCEGSLRITIGTEKENRVLLEEIKKYSSAK